MRPATVKADLAPCAPVTLRSASAPPEPRPIAGPVRREGYSPVEPAARSVRRDMAELVAG